MYTIVPISNLDCSLVLLDVEGIRFRIRPFHTIQSSALESSHFNLGNKYCFVKLERSSVVT